MSSEHCWYSSLQESWLRHMHPERGAIEKLTVEARAGSRIYDAAELRADAI